MAPAIHRLCASETAAIPDGRAVVDLGQNSLEQVLATIDFRQSGVLMHSFITDLYPICRSITGAGFRETLRCIGRRIPLEIREVATGTQVFDWTVPREWNITAGWVKDPNGKTVVDFRWSNLHVVNYSTPVRRRLPLSELREHLHTLPDRPDWIPYRTSYYKESWGFCLAHKQLVELQEGDYEVYIDSRLEDGSLTYGECYLPGERTDEILLSCHACHPSLCNDNLSGVALVTMLAELFKRTSLKYSYRFLFIPGCIGSITWLALNEDRVSRIRNGLVVACVGDPGKLHYKRSRRGDAEIDRASIHALRHRNEEFSVLDFSPFGYDERQYCSPGFNLAVGSLTRTPHGRFPEYHTSADDLEFVRPEALADSLAVYLSVIHILENDARYISLNPKCEPQLGRRGLYRTLGGFPHAGQLELAMLWVLNLSDGHHSLLDIAERAALSFESILQATRSLNQHGLLRELPAEAQSTLK
jgi:aminopeptidase-like protein